MRIIFLNLAEGELREPLDEFVGGQVENTDIFCFQEISDQLLKDWGSILNKFELALGRKYVGEVDYYFLATWVRKNWKIRSSEVLFPSQNEL